MHLRSLGPTGLTVTPLGLGLAALGRPGYINLGHADDLGRTYGVVAMESHSRSVLDAAWALGIRYFDAARSYGRAEDFLGRWLAERHIEPERVTVGSKWGYTYTADWKVDAEAHELKDHSLATFRRQLPESVERLGEHLQLYQVHSATFDSGVLDDRAVAERLASVRESGIAIGFTTSGPRQGEVIRRALQVEHDGRPLFDTVQSTWNVFEPSAGDALRDAHDAGLGVIVKEAVANGRLTERNPGLHAHSRRTLLASTGSTASIDAIALAAALRQEWADVVLSGAATVEQLHSNVVALSLAPALSTDGFESLAEPADQYWRTRQSLPWN